MSNSFRPPRRSWPYAVTAVLVLTVQEGWAAEDVRRLAATLLVLIALICVIGEGGEQ
ncbi:hypothetical protein [Streptomyces sp. NPDC001903]|uniref:hypothetical protein n=1 Tax=Streptomyces sp. NPDC001903 TaxID=3364622 RepID=UPI0036A84293